MTNKEWCVVIVKQVSKMFKTPLCDLSHDEKILLFQIDMLGIKSVDDFIKHFEMEKDMGLDPVTVRYDLTAHQEERLNHWHYHGIVDDTKRFQQINDKTKELAEMIMRMTPPGRNQALALTDLEMVRMRANAAIAVDECVLRGDACYKPRG